MRYPVSLQRILPVALTPTYIFHSDAFSLREPVSTSLENAPIWMESGMANFIVLKRPGPPTREVLVNLDQIIMVQPGQGTGGSAILFGREHVVTFEEDFATVIRRIQTGPYVEPGSGAPGK
jgi:hypothetical protein